MKLEWDHRGLELERMGKPIMARVLMDVDFRTWFLLRG